MFVPGKFLIYCLIITKTLEYDRFIPTNLLKEFVFKDSPKRWFSYVEAISFKMFERQLNQINMRNVLKRCFKLVNLFYMKAFTVSHYSVHKPSHYKQLNSKSIYFNITSPLGMTRCHGFSQEPQNFYWRIEVSNYLKINFTVQYLYLSANSYHKCDVSRLWLFDPFKIFKYCGIHSQIIFIFSGQLHTGQMDLFVFVSYDLLMEYSVMDTFKVVLLWTVSSLYKPILHSLLLPNRKLFLTYLIQVSKFQCIDLHVMAFDQVLEIFDGPGIYSSKLTSLLMHINTGHYKSSTFQIYILVQTKGNHLKFSYRSVISDQIFDLHIVEPGKVSTINFPHGKMCIESHFCFIKVSTNSGFYIKLETKYFIYKGYYSSNCSYGGLAAYESINSMYIELATLCITQDNSYIHRHIYSSSNSILLSLYFYKQYMKLLDIQLDISTTKCKRLILNACERRPDNMFSKYLPDAQPVYSYEIIQIVYVEKESVKEPNEITQCSALRIRFLPLSADLVTKIHWNITGFLRTFHHRNVSSEFLDRK